MDFVTEEGSKVKTLYAFLRQKPEDMVSDDVVEAFGQTLEHPGPAEHIVGELPYYLKVLCIVVQKYLAEMNNSGEDFFEKTDEGDVVNSGLALASADFHSAHYQVVKDLFDLSVKEEFEIFDKPNIDLRFGYIVTWTDEDADVAAQAPRVFLGKGSTADN